MDRPTEPVIPPYAVLRQLGRSSLGPSAQVRRGHDGVVVHQQQILIEKSQAAALQTALLGLAERLAALGSAGLPRILAVEPLPNEGLLVASEWREGEPLPTWLARASEAALLDCLAQVAALLSVTATAGLNHLGLTPRKILVEQAAGGPPRVSVLDVGKLACLPTPLAAQVYSARRQSPDRDEVECIAPEQRRAGSLVGASAAADVFALGRIWMSALSRLPGRKTEALGQELPAWSALCRAMQAEEPSSRPSLTEVAAGLRRLAEGGSAASAPSPPPAVPARSPGPAGSARAVASRPLGQGQRAPEDLLGQHLGDYRLTKILGRGGMGVVFEAVHAGIGRRVALKVLWNDLAKDPRVRERFRGEAQAANRIEHPNIVDITDLREAADGTLYLVMELLPGESLRKRLEATPTGLDPRTALRIAYPCALALAAAHRKGIVHRDFKPENVMLVAGGEEERVKVLDFGVAKILYDPQKEDLTNPALSAFLGTLEYAAPEQFGDPLASEGGRAGEGNDIGPPADVFALAVALCEMLSGQRPFPGFSMLLHLAEPPAPKLPSQASSEVRTLLSRMLARVPSERPTMEEVSQTLGQALRALEPPPPVVSRRPASLAVGLAGLGLLGISIAIIWPRLRPPAWQQAQLYVPQALALLRGGLGEGEVVLRRAAALGVSTAGQSELTERLVPLLRDADPRTAALAGLGLQRLPLPSAAEALQARAEASPISLPNVEAAAALERLQASQGRALLAGFLNSPRPDVRYLAAVRLCERKQVVGCDALRGDLAAGRLGPERELDALFTLATADDETAGPALQRKLLASTDKATQLGLAGYLARLPGPWADAARRTLAEAAQAGDREALQLAAKVPLDAGRDTLIAQLLDRRGSPATRMGAAAALADQGRLFGLVDPLGQVLSDASDRLEVRLATASALLRLCGPGMGERGDEDLQKICRRNPRLLACQLADLGPSDPGEAEGGYAESAVPERVILVQGLGGRSSRGALAVLLRALGDPNAVVRSSALRSLRMSRARLGTSGDPRFESSVGELSQRLSGSDQPAEQVIGLSLRGGEASARAQLMQILNRTGDVGLRLFVVEQAEGDPENPVLLAGLKDAVPAVRFAAARRLAEAGSPRGVPILKEALAEGDGTSLIAHALLWRLRQADAAAGAIDWSRVLSREGRMWTRFDAVGLLGELPEGQALTILRTALHDPEAAVRHRAAEAAMALYRRTRSGDLRGQLRELLTPLASDDELYVRSLAGRLLSELDPPSAKASGKGRRPPVEPEKSPPGPDPHPPAVPASSPPPVALPPSPSRTGTPPPPPPPKRPAEVRPSSPPMNPEPPAVEKALAQAGQAERRGNLLEAMQAVQRGQRSQPSARQQTALQAIFERLRRDLSSYRIQSLRAGACVAGERVWHKPGKHIVSNADAKEINTYLSAGKEYVCDFCSPTGIFSCKENH